MPLTEDMIYEAVFSPELWTDVLHELALLAKAEGAVLADVRNSQRPWLASVGVRNLYEDFFARKWSYDNVKTQTLLRTPHHGFISDADHISEQTMAEQPIYRDFFWKHGFGYAAATLIESPCGDAVAISIEKKKALGPVDRLDLDRLNAFRPHLARAALLASRLAYSRVEAALQSLQLIGLPAVALSEDSRALCCNTLFDTVSRQIIIGGRDRIRFQQRKADVFFEDFMMRQPRATVPGAAASLSFPIAADEANPPAIVHLVPVVGAGRDIFLRARYMLIVTPLDQHAQLSETVIKGLFDLTPAEARVASSLLSGLPVKRAAAELGLSVETVRTHVKSLLAKSGTNRQADFLAMMSGFRRL